jgi:hypothetical protein
MQNQIIFWGLVGIVILQIYSSVWSFKKRGFKGFILSLKEGIESLKVPFFMILGLYSMIGGIYLIAPINNLIAEQISNTTNPNNNWVYQGAMVAWLIGITYVYFLIIRKGWHPLFKYSDQETKWQEEDKQNNKFRQWLKIKFPRLIKDNENTKTS